MQTANIVNIPAGTITQLQTTGGTAPYEYRVLANPNGFVVDRNGVVAVPCHLTSGAYPLTVEVIDHSTPPNVEQHYIHLVVAGATTNPNPATASATATAHGAPVTTPTVTEAHGHGGGGHSSTNWPAIVAYGIIGVIAIIAIGFAMNWAADAKSIATIANNTATTAQATAMAAKTTADEVNITLAGAVPVINRVVSDTAGLTPTVAQHTTDIALQGQRLGVVEGNAGEALQLARQRPQVVRVRVSDPAPTVAPAPAQPNGALTPDQAQAWQGVMAPPPTQQTITVVPSSTTGHGH